MYRILCLSVLNFRIQESLKLFESNGNNHMLLLVFYTFHLLILSLLRADVSNINTNVSTCAHA